MELLSQTPGWTQIYAVSRRTIPDLKHVTHLPLDLSSEKAIESKFRDAGVSGVTHFFHCAFAGDMSNRDKTSHGWLKVLDTAAVVHERLSLIHTMFDWIPGIPYLHTSRFGLLCCARLEKAHLENASSHLSISMGL